MRPSSKEKVSELYENSAASYAEMMDAEIELAVYTDILARLTQRIVELPGAVVDTSCGPGHMLQRYRDRFDKERQLCCRVTCVTCGKSNQTPPPYMCWPVLQKRKLSSALIGL